MALEPYTGFKIVCDDCEIEGSFAGEGMAFVVENTMEDAYRFVLDACGLIKADGSIRCAFCRECAGEDPHTTGGLDLRSEARS